MGFGRSRFYKNHGHKRTDEVIYTTFIDEPMLGHNVLGTGVGRPLIFRRAITVTRKIIRKDIPYLNKAYLTKEEEKNLEETEN